MKNTVWVLLIITMILFITGCTGSEESGETDTKENEKVENAHLSAFDGKVKHVHGIGFLEKDILAFAAHEGIKIYKNEGWLESDFHKNDYMGFAAVKDGFYTSGHPGKASDLPNPIGIQQGNINEKELTSYGFEGESDFHAMGVGYNNEAIYVLNQVPNSEMDQGLYRSFNKGETWEKLKAENLGKNIFQIAVHPDDKKTLAISTETGVFFSKDAGGTFELISEPGQAGGLHFSNDRLLYGHYDGMPSLKEYDWRSEKTGDIQLPELKEDAVMYVAQNPEVIENLVIFTVQGDSFITNDSGETWDKIIDKGRVK
ncbi:hypothetical protein LCL89_05110 [Halobacillus yeomjeoni]|uniref:F510_1955 family glycosylhydrolase n=1 Tax=Halobacillus yeomjeoni TaxID=311194 RepID=UPI001CD2FF2B|nr:hypothetical protein [Halobacillus yeomjeoni]MCA0983430.1 hypothetical protein [Halobacillus yeomjeoni]